MCLKCHEKAEGRTYGRVNQDGVPSLKKGYLKLSITVVSLCSASLSKLILCWWKQVYKLSNLIFRANNANSTLAMEKWNSSLPLQVYWKRNGNLPNQSKCALWTCPAGGPLGNCKNLGLLLWAVWSLHDQRKSCVCILSTKWSMFSVDVELLTGCPLCPVQFGYSYTGFHGSASVMTVSRMATSELLFRYHLLNIYTFWCYLWTLEIFQHYIICLW